jgi:hypothetical protein
MESKICKRCGVEKPTSEFYKEGRGYIRPCCKSCESERTKAYKTANLEQVRTRYREANKKRAEQKREYDKNYVQNNKEIVALTQKRYWSKPENRERKARLQRERAQADVHARLVMRYRCRVHHALKHNRKSQPTAELIGCSVAELKSHLENQFQPGMSWDNYGDWHVDHIKPCASFDLSKPEQQQQCFHYSNLQPLWGRDNLLKSDKV